MGLPTGLMHMAGVMPWIANITGRPEHVELGTAAANEILSSPHRTPNAELVSHMALAHAAMVAGDVEAMETEYGELADARELWWFHPAPVRGALAYRLGKFEEGRAHFEGATERYRTAGYRLFLAWTAYQYSVACGDAGTESPAFVRSLEDDALEIARSLGMRPLVQKVLERREILKA